jgi:hypothetical protein
MNHTEKITKQYDVTNLIRRMWAMESQAEYYRTKGDHDAAARALDEADRLEQEALRINEELESDENHDYAG